MTTPPHSDFIRSSMFSQSNDDLLIYEFLIFNNMNRLLYYRKLSDDPKTVYDYDLLNKETRIMNTIGTAVEISRLCRAFAPQKDDMKFHYFKTNQYRFNMFETSNNLRFVIFSSLKDDTIDFNVVFTQLFQHYLDFVKRNYLYEQDSYINIPKFKENTNGTFTDILAKRKSLK
jgi:hypothetical protein